VHYISFVFYLLFCFVFDTHYWNEHLLYYKVCITPYTINKKLTLGCFVFCFFPSQVTGEANVINVNASRLQFWKWGTPISLSTNSELWTLPLSFSQSLLHHEGSPFWFNQFLLFCRFWGVAVWVLTIFSTMLESFWSRLCLFLFYYWKRENSLWVFYSNS